MPDKTSLTLIATGNEMVSYLETTAGYTVIKNTKGFFEYAFNDSKGNLTGSGLIARNGNNNLQKKLSPHARYSQNQLTVLSNAFAWQNQELAKKAGGKPFPSKGKRKVLTLLIQYPDLASTFSKSNFDSLMVKPNYNGNGSFKDYYLKSSYGQLDLDVDVFGWYTADSGYLYYAKSNPNYITNVGKLIRKAILSADAAGVDFSQYDNDKDGYVDGIIVMHSGIGAEEQSAPNANNFIWSHRYNLSNSGGSVLADGVIVDAYGCFPEKRYNGGSYSQVGIGVISHEFGHLLDLPDLYATNNLSEGSGNYANMAGGPWLNNERTPCLHDAWTRIQLGWLTPVLINTINTFKIPKALADSNFCFRINTPVTNEYFLLENRQKKGFDRYLPSKGLAIWHINSSKAKLLSQSSGNSVNNDTSNYGVGLIQADGRFDLEKGNNRGDGGDLFPGTSNNRSFTPFSSPSSSLNYKVGGIKQGSNVLISNIIQNSDSSITFTVGNKPSAGFIPSAITGCAPLTVQFENGSAFSTNYLWKFNDGSASTNKNELKTFNVAGSYPITLYVLDSINNPVDSVTQIITVGESPKAIYQLIRGDSNNFTLKNLSTNFLYIIWRFGTNQTSTANDPVYTVTSPGKVPFKLIAYSQNQCTDTAYGELDYWATGLTEAAGSKIIATYPNPYTNELKIQFQLYQKENIKLTLYDLLGSKIEDLYLGTNESGENLLTLKVNDHPSGLYFLVISGSSFKKIVRVIHQ
ncbi:MAG: M6 family metalloprotease domain-containing protein [Bacteroidia bacterium]|nr:M6 family metalloprotease domain-containing protein [Bacteroidia bacterium]